VRRAVPETLIVLSALVGVLALVATAAGLLWTAGSGPATFRTVHGATVQLFGQGVYRFDTLFQGAQTRGTDVITLVLATPLLAVAMLLTRRGSLRGHMLLISVLGYFLYVYTNVALGTAYNPLYLVYVALFAASLWGLALAIHTLDVPSLASLFSSRLPRRALALFMLAAGLLTLVVWLLLGGLLDSLVQGTPPKLLDSYTTMVTYVLDLGIITPACFLCGGALLRCAPLGYLLALPLLGIIVLLAPAIAAQTLSQIAAGVSFSPGEIVGPIAGFVGLGLIALWLLVTLLRSIINAPQPES
jgi:hypothetical protein